MSRNTFTIVSLHEESERNHTCRIVSFNSHSIPMFSRNGKNSKGKSTFLFLQMFSLRGKIFSMPMSSFRSAGLYVLTCTFNIRVCSLGFFFCQSTHDSGMIDSHTGVLNSLTLPDLLDAPPLTFEFAGNLDEPEFVQSVQSGWISSGSALCRSACKHRSRLFEV